MKFILNEKYILDESKFSLAEDAPKKVSNNDQQYFKDAFANASTQEEYDAVWEEYFNKFFGRNAAVKKKAMECRSTLELEAQDLGFNAGSNAFINYFNQLIDKNMPVTSESYNGVHNAYSSHYINNKDLETWKTHIFLNKPDLYKHNANFVEEILGLYSYNKEKFDKDEKFKKLFITKNAPDGKFYDLPIIKANLERAGINNKIFNQGDLTLSNLTDPKSWAKKTMNYIINTFVDPSKIAKTKQDINQKYRVDIENDTAFNYNLKNDIITIRQTILKNKTILPQQVDDILKVLAKAAGIEPTK